MYPYEVSEKSYETSWNLWNPLSETHVFMHRLLFFCLVLADR